MTWSKSRDRTLEDEPIFEFGLPRETSRAPIRSLSLISTIRLISRRSVDVQYVKNTAMEAGRREPPRELRHRRVQNGRGHRRNNGSQYFVRH